MVKHTSMTSEILYKIIDHPDRREGVTIKNNKGNYNNEQ